MSETAKEFTNKLEVGIDSEKTDEQLFLENVLVEKMGLDPKLAKNPSTAEYIQDVLWHIGGGLDKVKIFENNGETSISLEKGKIEISKDSINISETSESTRGEDILNETIIKKANDKYEDSAIEVTRVRDITKTNLARKTQRDSEYSFYENIKTVIVNAEGNEVIMGEVSRSEDSGKSFYLYGEKKFVGLGLRQYDILDSSDIPNRKDLAYNNLTYQLKATRDPRDSGNLRVSWTSKELIDGEYKYICKYGDSPLNTESGTKRIKLQQQFTTGLETREIE